MITDLYLHGSSSLKRLSSPSQRKKRKCKKKRRGDESKKRLCKNFSNSKKHKSKDKRTFRAIKIVRMFHRAIGAKILAQIQRQDLTQFALDRKMKTLGYQSATFIKG